MCTYKDIDIIQLPNGQTASEANRAASREIERIYADSWRRGVSVPFFDNDGNTYLANPDGSEDRVALDRRSRTYRILCRTAAPGKGRYSYLISRQMERRPELTIIAGPNGAGKSRLCPFYVSTKSFDGDKLMLDLRREHPDWPDRWVSGTVASQLEKQKAEALEQYKDFAFETNFSSDMVLHMIEDFRAAGFKISLCYFGLRNEDESVSRVIHRVQTGGHDVADDVIRFNFHEGLKNTQQHLRLFDNLTFIDGNSDYGHIVALHISKSQTHKVVDNPPQWFKEQFEEFFSEL